MKHCHACRRDYPANKFCPCSKSKDILQALIESIAASLSYSK